MNSILFSILEKVSLGLKPLYTVCAIQTSRPSFNILDVQFGSRTLPSRRDFFVSNHIIMWQ